MDERVLLFISAIVEVLISYKLFSHFFIRKDSNYVRLVIISAVLVIVLTGIGMLKILLLNTFLSLLLYFLYIMLLFKVKWWQAALWSVIFVLLGMLSEIATSFSVSFAFGVHIENTMIMTWYKLIVYIISKSILYIIVRIIITIFHVHKEIESDKTILYLLLFPILAILNEHLLIRLTMQLDISQVIMAISSLIGIGLILGGFLLITLYDRAIQKKQVEKELQLAQSRADSNEKFLLMQERNLKDARTTIHDFKNQLINLRALYEDSSLDALVYHDSLMDSLKRQMKWQLLDVNNKVFSNILIRVQMSCEQLGIDFDSQISCFELGFIDPIDTSSLFDNAFDNAIQACELMDGKHKRWICFKLYKKDCFLFCEVINSHSNTIKAEKGKLVSSKADKEHHGIGINNIKTTASKYGGDISYSYNDSEFHLSIRLSSSM